MLLVCCDEVPAFEHSDIWDKVLPSIITVTFAVFLFIVGRILDNVLRANEIRRNWYQKVIIDPNILKLNGFYTDVISQTKASIEVLVSSKGIMSFDNYISAKALEINKIKNIIRAFDYEFIRLVQTNFPEISERLYEHLRDFEDCLTVFLDKQNLTNEDFVSAERECLNRKYLIYQILYLPLEFKRPSLRRFLSKHFLAK